MSMQRMKATLQIKLSDDICSYCTCQLLANIIVLDDFTQISKNKLLTASMSLRSQSQEHRINRWEILNLCTLKKRRPSRHIGNAPTIAVTRPSEEGLASCRHSCPVSSAAVSNLEQHAMNPQRLRHTLHAGGRRVLGKRPAARRVDICRLPGRRGQSVGTLGGTCGQRLGGRRS